jgi:hypothetical protein
LFLNVNRALNHQREKLESRQDGAIFKRLNPAQHSPTMADNLAPLVLCPNEHDNARAEYIKQTVAAIRADVHRAAGVSDASGSRGIIVTGRPTGFALWEVETCWDIGGAGFDARRALESITPLVRLWGGRRGWEGNEGSITTVVTDSERLVIYAKEDNRLRFEIRHRPTHGKKPYTAPSVSGLIAKLDEFRRMAAQTINRHWGPIHARLTRPTHRWDWTAFALEWGACCGNSDASKAILGMLMREQRFFGGRDLEYIHGWANMKRKARDRGLLRFENGAYHPTMPGGNGRTLTSFDDSASLPGHNPETHSVASVPKSLTPIRKRRDGIRLPPCPPPPKIVDCRSQIEDLKNPLTHQPKGGMRPPAQHRVRTRWLLVAIQFHRLRGRIG